jgi:REP element-mobilizing transposase RayT
MAIAVGLSPISIRNGAYYASPIHCYIVSSVKYRKALLDEAVTTIIQETAAEIAERFPMVGGG